MKVFHYISRITIIFLLLFVSGMRGQILNPPAPELPKIMPPSPTVANLMQFEEVPVDNYTGQPDISIPLLSKPLGNGLSLNMALKYNTQGVKIQSRSGWTGTGWSLDAGGVISRTVRGVADEKMKGIGKDITTGVFHLPEYWKIGDEMFDFHNRAEYVWNVNGTRLDKYDSELDLFQFNALGLSGRFIIIKSGTALVAKQLSTDQKLKIIIDYDDVTYAIDGFTVTDANGNQYLFDKKEITTSVLTNIIDPQGDAPISPAVDRPETESVSAWYLSEVRSNTNTLLATFNYTVSTEAYADAPNTTSSSFKIPSQISQDMLLSSYNVGQLRPRYSYSYNDISITTQKLNTITFPDGTYVEFTHSSTAHPETQGVYLTGLKFKRGSTPPIKDYTFSYSTVNDRLWLDKVSENGLDYTLTYYNKTDLPGFYNVASSTSAWNISESDSWGYKKSYWPGMSSHGFHYYIADAYKVGLLTSMTYPTGGVKVFEFEPHTFSWQGDKKIEDFTANPLNIEVAYTTPQRFHIDDTAFKQADPVTDVPFSTQPPLPELLLDHDQDVYISFDINTVETNCSNPQDCINLYALIFYDGTTEVNRIPLSARNTSCYVHLLGGHTYTYKLIENLTDYSIPGNDTDDVHGIPTTTFVDGTGLKITIELMYTNIKTDFYRYLMGGGVRIKDVVFMENPEAETPARKFSYNYDEPEVIIEEEDPEDPEIIDLGNNGSGMHPNSYYTLVSPFSSGAIDGRADNLEKEYEIEDQKHLYGDHTQAAGTFTAFWQVPYKIHSKAPMVELTKGNYIGYKYVRVFQEDNGYTDYTYNSVRDFPSPENAFYYPFTISPNLDFMRGLLTKSVVSDQAGRKLSETVNSYLYQQEVQAKTWNLWENPCKWRQFYDFYDNYANYTPEPYNRPLCHMPMFDGECLQSYTNCGSFGPFSFASTDLVQGWAKLTQSIQTEFLTDSTTDNEVVTKNTFVYSTDNYQISQKESTIKQKGAEQVYKTTYQYPGYYTASFFTTDERAAISDMFDKNVVNVPLVIRNYKNEVLLSTVVNKYDSIGRLKTIQLAKGGQALEDRITYHTSDSSGNPVWVSKTGGLNIVYLWGYNNTLPVAMIENAGLDAIWEALHPGVPMEEAPNDSDLADIETVLSNPAFANARLTKISQVPGVGIKSITDPNGKTTTFNYDDFERLKFTEDNDGKVVSMNAYHYKDGSDPSNWVQTTVFNDAVVYNPSGVTGSSADKTINKTFLDGLGRPIQSIAHKQAGDGGDIISFIKYDALGRQPVTYLPYTRGTPSLSIDGSPESSQTTFYSTYSPSSSYPYSETDFEHSPLGRTVEQSAPGESWNMTNEHTVKTAYETNGDEEVRLFTVTVGAPNSSSLLYEPPLPGGSDYYLTGELYKTIVKDENWTAVQAYVHDHTTEEFKNPEGQVVLKRTYNDNTPHDTYYVYDQYGNLTYVIPPAVTVGSSGVTQAQLDGLCYQYKYDYRNRMAEKKLPGKQWEYIVYDRLDRVTATGPAFYPYTTATATTGWTITKYDAFSRAVYTAWYPSSSITSATRKAMQDTKNAATVFNESKTTSGNIDSKSVYYTNNIAPTAVKLLTVSYYDNYSFPNVSAPNLPIEDEPVSTAVKGLLTGQWLKVYGLNNSMTGNVVNHYYDKKSREIGTYTTRYASGGYITVKKKLDFTGKPLYTTHQHRKATGGTVYGFTDTYSYTPEDRLAYHTHKMSIGSGGTEQLLALNSYDKLGQLAGKKVGGTSTAGTGCFQNVNYSYNIRGWMTGINDTGNLQKGSDPKDLFAFSINYNDPTGTADALYNGNISEAHWITAKDEVLRMYSYGYDGLNRLLDATFQKESEGAINDYYGEHITGYDKNGNIMGLERYGGVNPSNNEPMKIDHLIYGYNGANPNQLVKVDEDTDGNAAVGFKDVINTVDYVYDANGNMVKDFNKGIVGAGNTDGIIYNHLNLPMKITFANGDKIEYFYQADGVKVQKVVTQGTTVTTTDYIDGIQYTNNVLDFVPTAEGYVKNTVVGSTNTYSYVYNYTDHLGNVRLSYAKSPSNVLTILEENNFYPFGMKHSGYNNDGYAFGSVSNALALVFNGAQTYKYKFQGQERQDELGLNWDSFKWRNYDPAIARFMCIDPLAEKYPSNGVYNFSENKVVVHRELEGLESVYIFDQANNPDNKRVYTADVYVMCTDGTVNGPYKGSSYPSSDTKSNTAKTGTKIYNNKSGHKGGTKKGLNIVNSKGERTTAGTAPDGSDTTMGLVNVHSGQPKSENPSGLENRGSEGCPTIKPDDAADFFANFDWTNTAKTTGTNNGTVTIYRGDSAEAQNDRQCLDDKLQQQEQQRLCEEEARTQPTTNTNQN